MRDVILLIIYLAVMAGFLGGVYYFAFKTEGVFHYFKSFGKK